MADISDVEQALVDLVTSVLYPLGITEASLVGCACRIYRGWPNSATLNADLSAGSVNVTVTADNDSGRSTTRYLPEWKSTVSPTGVTATVTDRQIFISGTPRVGDVVGALINGCSYVYRIQAGDRPDLVAANLNQLIQADHASHVSGAVISVLGGGSMIRVRAVADGTASFESRRQEKDLRTILWCPSPPVRDLVASSIDAAIDQLGFMALPDGTNARIMYRNTSSYDQAQNALLYRRDLVYTVEYPTISTVRLPAMLFGRLDTAGSITYG